MVPERALGALWESLHELRDGLRNLRLTFEDDHPATNAVPQPVQRAATDVDDMFGQVSEGIEACAAALAAVSRHDALAARRALRTCHEQLDALGRGLAGGLAAPERLDDLTTVARERGPAWHGWLVTALDGIGRIQRAQWDAHAALVPCWADATPIRPQHSAPRAALLTEEDQ